MKLSLILSIKNTISTFAFFLLIYRLIICFNYNPEISVGETNNIWNALQVAEGKMIYSNPEEKPFEIFQYTPLSQIPIIVAAKILNSNSLDYTYNVMVFGRLISLIFNILTFFLVFLILKNSFKVSKTLSFSAAICGFGLLTHLSFAIRPDALSLLFSTFSIYLFSIGYLYSRIKCFIYCGFVFAVSFFVKQDSFLILSALGLCLLMAKSWKYLGVLAVTFSISLTILLLFFKLILGEFFLFSIFGGVSVGYSITQAYGVFERFLHLYGFFLYASIIVSYFVIKGLTPKKEGFLLMFLAGSAFIIALFVSFKIGSWVNYYTPFVTYSLLLLFYVAYHLSKNKWLHITEIAMGYFTIIIVSFFIFQQIYNYTSPFLKNRESKKQYITIVNKFNKFKSNAELNNYVIFTFDKRLKLFLYKNTIMPNTEFYHVSRFSFEGYKKLNSNKKLTHVIKDSNLDASQFSALEYYHVPFSEFKQNIHIQNYIIYEYGR